MSQASRLILIAKQSLDLTYRVVLSVVDVNAALISARPHRRPFQPASYLLAGDLSHLISQTRADLLPFLAEAARGRLRSETWKPYINITLWWSLMTILGDELTTLYSIEDLTTTTLDCVRNEVALC